MKRRIIKFGTVFGIILLIEVIILNFYEIRHSINAMNSDVETYAIGNEELEWNDWTETKGVHVTAGNSNIVYHGPEQYVYYLKIVTDTKSGSIPDVILTSNDANGNLSQQRLRGKKIMYAEIGGNLSNLQIDYAPSVGFEARNVSVVLNPVGINFSIARVIAMLFVYYGTNALFKLHKSPDYGLESIKTDEEN